MTNRTDKSLSSTVRRGSTVGTILFMLLGPIVWAAQFTALYFSQSVLCQIGTVKADAIGDTINLAIWLVTVAAASLIAAALLVPTRFEALLGADAWQTEQRDFHRRTMAVLSIMALLAIAAGASGTMLIDECGALR